VSARAPKVDVSTYDLGAEARAPQWFAGRALTFNAFAGAGAGGRGYNYRDQDVDATRHISAYVAAGGEVGIRRMHVRVEFRDYVGGFTPLAAAHSQRRRPDGRTAIQQAIEMTDMTPAKQPKELKMFTPAIRTVLLIGLTIAVSHTSSRATAMEPQHPGGPPVADSRRPAIVIDSPAPDSTVRGPAIIVFRTENIRIMSVFVPEVADAGSAPGGHLHVKVDSGEWHWVHTSVDPVVVSGLPPGKHTVRLELADQNHRPLDVQTVTFTIAAPHIH
jgi:hypothetical protein